MHITNIRKHPPVTATENQDIDIEIFVGKLDALIQSFNSQFRDFDQCRLLLKLFADPFGVSVDDLITSRIPAVTY